MMTNMLHRSRCLLFLSGPSPVMLTDTAPSSLSCCRLDDDVHIVSNIMRIVVSLLSNSSATRCPPPDVRGHCPRTEEQSQISCCVQASNVANVSRSKDWYAACGN